MAGMSQEEIRRVLAANLAAVPNVIGVSNHMGSKVTEDRAAMITIMNEVFSRGLFFFDSRTTPNSTAPRVARDMGAPLLENARFLDHIADETYVVDQIRAAARIALSRGSAAVIGHVRPTTVRALARMIPELAAAGVELVRLDELMPSDWKSTVATLRKPTAEPTAEVHAGSSVESYGQPQPEPQPQSGGAAAPPQDTTDSPAPAAAVPTETGHEAAAPIQMQPVPAGEAEPESAVQPLPDDGQSNDSGSQAEPEPGAGNAPSVSDEPSWP